MADFSQVPLSALKTKTRCLLSQMLNAIKIIPSPSGLPRYFFLLDYQMFLHNFCSYVLIMDINNISEIGED